jgi:hypothetical protein
MSRASFFSTGFSGMEFMQEYRKSMAVGNGESI